MYYFSFSMSNCHLPTLLTLILGVLFAIVAVNDHRYRNEIDDLHSQLLELRDLVYHYQTDQQEQRNLVLTTTETRRLAPYENQQENSTTNGDPSPSPQMQGTSFTFASEFGVVGDGTTDDTTALQSAIDAAAVNASGGTVILPKGTFLTKSTLRIPGGVTVKGQGYGSSPLAIQFDAGGSTIAYCGVDYAVKMDGHSSSLQDLAVYDWRYPAGSICDQIKAAGGVLIDADKKGLESITMSNVLIYWFMGGTSLTLRARNGGGIAYNNFQNIRIRHADTAISLEADDTSFVNSNSFIAGAISGDINTVGISARGPGACNDNKVLAMVVEPPRTELAHVYVTGAKTNIRLLDVRLEGTGMAAEQKPLVIIDESSYGNVMTGMLGHTHIQANLNRNPGIHFISSKSVSLDPAPLNQYWNSAFKGFNNGKIPGWKIPANSVVTLSQSDPLYADHNVIHIEHFDNDGPLQLEADGLQKSPDHSFVTFGIYAKSSHSNAISAAMRYESGSIIASASHSGSGEWEFIGMSGLYSKTAPWFYFSISDDVEVTAPTFVYGETPAIPGASLMSSSGARMAGTIAMGMTTAYPPVSGNFWVLPKNEGNIFIMDMQGNPRRSIQRINHNAIDRFPRGSVVTLMFAEAGTSVVNGGYIKLKGGQSFTSTTQSSLTLVANGDPTWTEVSRNG